tara:strand:- start:37 stop:231 length:195 start_codon:yes stop_codon:yes gene_type:complete
MKILKGDKFVCIKKVVMNTKKITYKKGFVYISEIDECITNDNLDTDHKWSSQKQLKQHFVKLKK